MSRFDPDPSKPYGNCVDCDEVFADRAEMSAHLRATSAAGKGHTGRGTNRTRAERIESGLQQLADDALSEFVDNAWRLTESEGVTVEEITEAARSVAGDFSDAWDSRDE